MHNFVDLHCHTLYEIDDGAKSIEVSKEMLKLAYDDGIRTICFTPHFKIHHFSDDKAIESYNNKINRNFNSLVEFAKDTYPDLMLILGNEVLFHADICESLASKKCKLIGETKYILVEFRPESTIFEIKDTLLKLSRKGYLPILAHIERYSALYKNLPFLEELHKSGIVLQINSLSLNIRFGKTARFIKKLLKNSLVDLICTDSHDNNLLVPKLSVAYDFILRKYGDSFAKKIFYTNPQRILKNERLL
ncbi:MAG: PHP domain-containing protein [Clostridia bacterium]|nr:PHP domain-containing protein [Clostridia bacterium]